MLISFCKNSSVNNEGRTSGCERNFAGVSLVAVGVAAVILAGLVAGGVFEQMGISGSNMYGIAAGLTVASLVPFLVGGYLLSIKMKPYQQIGDKNSVLQDPNNF